MGVEDGSRSGSRSRSCKYRSGEEGEAGDELHGWFFLGVTRRGLLDTDATGYRDECYGTHKREPCVRRVPLLIALLLSLTGDHLDSN